MEEEWRIIPSIGFPYMVSNLGRVKRVAREITYKNGSVRHDPERLMSPCYNEKIGRWYIMISQHGEKRKNFLLHRLVAEAFCENDDPVNKITINHKDGNPSNNSAANLEWASYGENLFHAYHTLDRPKNATSAYKRPCEVQEISTGKIMTYESIAAAARGIGLSETQIRRIIDGESHNKTYQAKYLKN